MKEGSWEAETHKGYVGLDQAFNDFFFYAAWIRENLKQIQTGAPNCCF